jgi:AcrR family transcriptional regulator
MRLPRQLRSEETFDRMVNAGHVLIERHGGFDHVAVSEVILLANTSVGAFYGRFKDKDSFIDTVLSVVFSQLIDNATEVFGAMQANSEQLSAAQVTQGLVTHYVQMCRDNCGLFRASLRHFASLNPDSNPMRALSRHIHERFVPVLLQKLVADAQRKGQSASALEADIRVALQMMVGTLVHIMLTNPGPMYLQNDDMDAQLFKLMSRVLDLRE